MKLSRKTVGLGNRVFVEVNIGVPQGHVDFMRETEGTIQMFHLTNRCW
ncbi:hypothetical protein CA13_01120 [Planctomycetes bacterium CA13]|uniref:Uncharacterized protein n=1 Tax=Novipirellula herctigrandis TaxID=2527986 RepID=A0A5C5YUR7_9BACT|nr:hypothetical protein CA13_01120 [Planctomycetes bacterium CA13]